MDCGALGDPANGQVEYTATTFGSVAEYTCDSGCDPVGDSTRICTDEGTWSGSTPQCPGNQICVVQHIYIKCKNISIEILKDIGMVVPKIM